MSELFAPFTNLLEHAKAIEKSGPKKRKPRGAKASTASAPPVSGSRAAAGTSFFIGDHVEIGTEYARALGAHAVFDDGAIFLYDASCGTFKALEDAEESCRVQEYSGSEILNPDDEGGQKKTKYVRLKASDVAGIIKLAHDRCTRRAFFAGAPAGLAFADVFVEVTAAGIVAHQHSPTHRARYGYPFATTGIQPPERFLSFLGEIFLGDADAEAKKDFVQEITAGALLGLGTKYQRCAVFLGEGSNAKNTLLEILRSVFPPGSVVAVPPQRWEDQYCRAMLAGALLNAVSELPEKDILESHAFKAIVTGDEVEARHIYKAPFFFNPRAAHLFATNRLPGSSDTSEGFWRRFSIVKFNREFKGAAVNVNLAAEIIAAERAGIVGWLLEGAERLVRRGRYELPPSSLEAVDAWRRRSNPIAIFVDEKTQPATTTANPGTLATVLYDGFKAWCERNGHKGVVSSTKFGMRLRELGVNAKHTKAGALYPVLLRVGDGGDDRVTTCRHQDSRGGADA